MAIVPHFAFPLRLDGSGHIAIVQQDSVDDILGCVFMALKTPIGSRPYVPNFGVDDYTFATAPVRLSEIQAQVIASEPRAEINLSEKVNELVETIVVGVGNVG